MAYIKQEPVDDDGYGDGFGLDLSGMYDFPEPAYLLDDFNETSSTHAEQDRLTPASPEPSPYRGSLSRFPAYKCVDSQEDRLGQLARPRAQSPSACGGELSERSRQVRQAKRYGNYPDGIFGNVFETTGMIVGSTTCLRVTHMMIDTGASSIIIISAAAAKQANLRIINCDPQTFFLANGSKTTYNQLAHFELYISGIHNKVVAFIDQGNAGHHVLLGKPGIKAFNATANFSYGRKKETRWFVAQDEKGLRRHKILLHEDPANVASMMIPYGRYEGLRLAMPLGETATQRNSREILERADKKRDKLYKKHEKNVLWRGDVRDFPDLFGRQSE